MKPTKHLVILAMIFMVFSCQKDDNQGVEFDHLISATLKRSISEEEMEALFILAKQFYPEIPDYAQEHIGGIKVYYLEYASTYLDGEKIVLSGLVFTPDDASGESIIVSVQNGTLVEFSSAPSKDLDNPSFLLMQMMASLGYVMVIHDYIGFGASEAYPHPYHVKSLFQSTVKDMLLATKEMATSGDYTFQLSGELLLTGYSLGGWASLVSHHYLENDPIDGLALIGSVCGAGAYNLLDMQEYLLEQTDYRQPYYIALLFSGYISVGAIQDDLSLFFNEPYDLRIPDLIDGTHSPSQINSQLSYNMSELLSQRLLTEFDSHPDFAPLKQALIDNSQQAWVNKAPIYLFHGDADEEIPFSISEDLFADFQNMGAGPDRIRLVRLEGADHSTGSMSMYLTLMNLVQDGDLDMQTKSWGNGY
jgi:pimeloyl-ACP methyl ester carboxylesterase